jgi:hypothetical protein
MSDARELKQKLEEVQAELRQARAELEKQRARHAKEQGVLRKTLETTRREAERLRARVEMAETVELGRRVAGRPKPVGQDREEQAATATQMLVALARPPPSVEEALPALSRLLRLSPVDVRLRLAGLHPFVMARLPVPEAERLRDELIGEGFAAMVCEVSRLLGGLLLVRRFTLEEQGLSVESPNGERQRVDYAQLRLLARGRRKSVTVDKQLDVEYDRISLDDAKPARKVVIHEVKQHHIENFLWVYGGEVRAAITEETSFAGLGAPRVPTKFAALQALMGELQKRAPQVVVDERLLRTQRLAIPLVDPDRGQEVLAGLTDKAIQEGLWP